MSNPSGFIGLLCGVALSLLGVWILASGGVTLPTRDPTRAFHFSGLAQVCLGLSPLIAGLPLMAIARGALQVESKLTQFAIVVTLTSLAMAFILASRG